MKYLYSAFGFLLILLMISMLSNIGVNKKHDLAWQSLRRMERTIVEYYEENLV